MAKRISIISIVIAIVLSVQFIPSQGKKTMSKYRWYPTESSPKLYPMEIVKGNLIFSDGSSIYIPDHKVVSNGWGETGSSYISGEDIKPVPVKLEIHWFSYAENKFYSGSYELPYDEMLTLFDKGMSSPVNGDKITYNRIIVGIAPEGEISVWLTAEGIVTEVASFKAKEAQTDWTEIIESKRVSREQYIDMVFEDTLETNQIEDLKEKGVPAGLWETYRQQNHWQPEVIGSQPLVMWVKTFNGEQEYFNFSDSDNSRTHRAIPKRVKINWLQKSGQKYTATIHFDEEEIFKAYEKLITDKPEHKITLQLEISEAGHTIDVFLKDEKFILKLEKNEMKVYKME